MYFRSETDVAKNLISNFFSNFDCQKNLLSWDNTAQVKTLYNVDQEAPDNIA